MSGLPEREYAGPSIIDDQTADGIRQKRSIGFYEGLAMLSLDPPADMRWFQRGNEKGAL